MMLLSISNIISNKKSKIKCLLSFLIFQMNSLDDYVDPVLRHVEAVSRWPEMRDEENGNGKRIFILGHSMGGLVALLAVLKRQDLFKVSRLP